MAKATESRTGTMAENNDIKSDKFITSELLKTNSIIFLILDTLAFGMAVILYRKYLKSISKSIHGPIKTKLIALYSTIVF